MSTFKERIYELRKQRKLTQNELAEYIGLNKQTISQYERGVRRPDFETLEQLCDFFNVSADYMLGKVDITLRYVDSHDLAKLDSPDPVPDPLRLRSTSPDSAAPSQHTLSPDESGLLDDYEKLNEYGKKKIREDLHDMTQLPKYTQESDLWEMDGVS